MASSRQTGSKPWMCAGAWAPSRMWGPATASSANSATDVARAAPGRPRTWVPQAVPSGLREVSMARDPYTQLADRFVAHYDTLRGDDLAIANGHRTLPIVGKGRPAGPDPAGTPHRPSHRRRGRRANGRAVDGTAFAAGPGGRWTQPRTTRKPWKCAMSPPPNRPMTRSLSGPTWRRRSAAIRPIAKREGLGSCPRAIPACRSWVVVDEGYLRTAGRDGLR